MKPMRRRVAIGIVVLGSGLLGERAVSLLAPDDSVVGPIEPKRARNRAATSEVVVASPSAAQQAVHFDRLEARRLQLDAELPAAGTSLFDPVSWQPPAPPRAQERAAVPKPAAPPFPYAYIGGLVEDGVRTAFFSKGNRVLPVKAGDTVDAVFRVDQMTDSQMKLTYLPLDEPLTVPIGSSP